jgi:hypothetical protein
MTRRAGLRRTEPLTDLTDRSVIGVTRARVTVETKSSVRSVKAPQPSAASEEKLLREAASVLINRRKQYGPASVLLDGVARRWSITLGHPVTPAQVVLCMIDLKLARLAVNSRHRDSAIDVAGYAALLAELW